VPKRYPAEFRSKVLELIAAGRPVAQVAADRPSASCPQRRHPGRAASGQPGPAGRAAHATAAAGPGLDQGPGRGVAGPRERSTVAVWTEYQLAEFLRFVEADRLYALWWLIATRAAPRRGRRAALGRRRSRRPGGQDQPAAPRLRQHGRGRFSQDRRQPTHHRPGPGHRHGAAVTGAVRRRSESPLGRCGRTPGTCSPHPTGSRCTRTI
jgi:hypothetical protein